MVFLVLKMSEIDNRGGVSFILAHAQNGTGEVSYPTLFSTCLHNIVVHEKVKKILNWQTL